MLLGMGLDGPDGSLSQMLWTDHGTACLCEHMLGLRGRTVTVPFIAGRLTSLVPAAE